jgi:hypothetical protein
MLLLSSQARASVQQRPILSLSLEEKADDDALGGGLDLMTKLCPEIGYERKSQTLTLDARYSADLVRHLPSWATSVDHRARLTLRSMLSQRAGLHAEAMVFQVADASSLPRMGVARGRFSALWAKTHAAIEVQVGRRDRGELGYDGEVAKLDGATLALGAVHTPYARFSRALSRRADLGLRARTQLFTAERALSSVASSLSGAARFWVSPNTTLVGEAGPVWFLRRGESVLLVRARGEVNYSARGWEAGLTASRDLAGATGFASEIWSEEVRAGVSRRVSEWLSLFGSAGGFRNGRAPAEDVAAYGYGASAGAEVRFGRGFSTSLSGDRVAQWDARGAALGLSRTLASLKPHGPGAVRARQQDRGGRLRGWNET